MPPGLAGISISFSIAPVSGFIAASFFSVGEPDVRAIVGDAVDPFERERPVLADDGGLLTGRRGLAR